MAAASVTRKPRTKWALSPAASVVVSLHGLGAAHALDDGAASVGGAGEHQDRLRTRPRQDPQPRATAPVDLDAGDVTAVGDVVLVPEPDVALGLAELVRTVLRSASCDLVVPEPVAGVGAEGGVGGGGEAGSRGGGEV